MITGIAETAIRYGTGVLYASLGETVSERSGVINLGTEGSMLTGALAAVVVSVQTGNPWLGVLAATLAGGALAAVHGTVCVYLNGNQIASGLAVFFLGLGATGYLGQEYTGAQVPGFDELPIPGLSSIPFFGQVLFNHTVLTYLLIALVPLVWWFLYRTRAGLVVRACGERPEVAFAHGFDPRLVRFSCVVVGGMFAGVGGAQLSIALTKQWAQNMVAGLGFVAVALVIFSAWSPIRAAGAALLFGAAFGLGLQLQAHGVPISNFLLDMLPYLLTIVVLAFMSRRQARAMPEGLKEVFEGT